MAIAPLTQQSRDGARRVFTDKEDIACPGSSRDWFGIARIINFTAANNLAQRAANPCQRVAKEPDTSPNHVPAKPVEIGGSLLQSSAQF